MARTKVRKGMQSVALTKAEFTRRARERFAGRELSKRKDVSDTAKAKILEANPARLYHFN